MLRELEGSCVIARARLISRVMTNIFDEELQRYGLVSSQHTLLGSILRLGTATRAEIGRANCLDRSTLTRSLKLMLDAGWIEEIADRAEGRRRPLRLTKAGENLLFSAMPAWRAGQERALRVLGQSGMDAVKRIADNLPRD
jgi:DNA-binding MarR family transcriptional regulator